MKYRQTFTVTGSGVFPLDMLRYDACWPAHEREIWMLGGSAETRDVHISRNVEGKHDVPTLARWASFGWTVTDVKTEKRF